MTTKYPADGQLFVGWLSDDDGSAIADIEAPTEAELSSVLDLSCDIQSGGVDTGISTATIDAGSICSAFISQSVGRTSVAPTLTFWRYRQPDDTAWETFNKGDKGWLIIRAGVESSEALSDSQNVTLAWVEASEPTPSFPGGDTNTTFDLSFVLINGQKFTQKAWIGGAS